MASELYIGIMSGTSLDGVDAVLVDFGREPFAILASTFVPFSADLRSVLLKLNCPDRDELVRAAAAGIELSRLYAAATLQVLAQAGLSPAEIAAIGCHGQTVRHRPERGYTIQVVNPAWLVELAGITVVADFRSRDVAAGGQGAPLVPACHDAVFRDPARHRTVVNIGGISNLTYLPVGQPTTGFDCGPGNMLLDAWITEHCGLDHDHDGAWAQTGSVREELLGEWYAHPFFHRPPPKSTGRDEFSREWLERGLTGKRYSPADVQATLLQLSAVCIADAIGRYCARTQEVYLCGGGSRNGALRRAITALLPGRQVRLTDELGVAVQHVEAVAFAWLARQTLNRRPGNLPQVTGARQPVVLGAIYWV